VSLAGTASYWPRPTIEAEGRTTDPPDPTAAVAVSEIWAVSPDARLSIDHVWPLGEYVPRVGVADPNVSPGGSPSAITIERATKGPLLVAVMLHPQVAPSVTARSLVVAC